MSRRAGGKPTAERVAAGVAAFELSVEAGFGRDDAV
jgi:hypothetical protein